MSDMTSALYTGWVMHHRMKPRVHRLKYSMFSLLIDLDDRSGLLKRLKLLSRNRFNLFSFYDRDFGNKTNEPLRAQIERDLNTAGIEANGAIKLFAMPRILGYAFNPLSVYFCYHQDGTLSAIIYEVHNTFKERHSYLIPVDKDAHGSIRQNCAKRLYVSPFLEMDLTYSFKISAPDEQVGISILVQDGQGPVMTAVLSAERRKLTDTALLRAFVLYPLLTLKVIAGIHWEALLIWLKGIRLQDRPPPPAKPITIVASASLSDTPHKDLSLNVVR